MVEILSSQLFQLIISVILTAASVLFTAYFYYKTKHDELKKQISSLERMLIDVNYSIKNRLVNIESDVKYTALAGKDISEQLELILNNREIVEILRRPKNNKLHNKVDTRVISKQVVNELKGNKLVTIHFPQAEEQNEIVKESFHIDTLRSSYNVLTDKIFKFCKHNPHIVGSIPEFTMGEIWGLRCHETHEDYPHKREMNNLLKSGKPVLDERKLIEIGIHAGKNLEFYHKSEELRS